MILAIVYLIGGALLAGFVVWVLVAGGEPLVRYLDAQAGPLTNDAWRSVLAILAIGVMMIFFGLRTLLGKEGRMSRLAQLREERMEHEGRTRESDVLRGPRPRG